MFFYGSAKDYLRRKRRGKLRPFDEDELLAALDGICDDVSVPEAWWRHGSTAWWLFFERNDEGRITSVGGDLYPGEDWEDLYTVLMGMKRISDALGARLWVMNGEAHMCIELNEAGMGEWLKSWARSYVRVTPR